MSKKQKINNFVDMLWYSKTEVIVKLKNSYQCLSKTRRYSVGTGKEGKYFSINSYSKLKEYVIKKRDK